MDGHKIEIDAVIIWSGSGNGQNYLESLMLTQPQTRCYYLCFKGILVYANFIIQNDVNTLLNGLRCIFKAMP